MIRIKDDYVIIANEDEYIAAIDRKRVDKKGNAIYKNIGYYSTLENALKGLYNYMIRKGLSENEYNLSEAIAYVTKMHEEMIKMIKEGVKET